MSKAAGANGASLERADVVVMAVYVMVMMMVMAIMRRCDALRVQPLRDARDFPGWVVEPAIEDRVGRRFALRRK